MKRLLIYLLAVFAGGTGIVCAQVNFDEFDTVYKYPDRRGKRMKVIRGKVTQETTEGVVYTIGLNQKKRIEPSMVQKVEYGSSKNQHLNKAREQYLKGVTAYEEGDFNVAAAVFERALRTAREHGLDDSWVGAYGRYYLGRSLVDEGLDKKEKGLLKAIYRKRFKDAVKAFEELNEKFPSHRLQMDLPVPYARALMNTGNTEDLEKAVRILDDVSVHSRNQYVLLKKLKALKLKGDVLKEAGKLDGAESAYKEMLRVAPKGPAIDEIVHLKQFIRIYLGIVIFEKAQKKSVPEFYDAAEEYFRGILTDVSATGIRVGELDKIYFYLGECRFKRDRKSVV